MLGNRQNSDQELVWRRELQMLAALVNPLRNVSLVVALTITFVVEMGQPDALYWFPLVLLTIEVCLVIVTTLIGEIAVTIIDIAVAWCQRLAQPQHAMSSFPPLTRGGKGTGVVAISTRGRPDLFKRATPVGPNVWE